MIRFGFVSSVFIVLLLVISFVPHSIAQKMPIQLEHEGDDMVGKRLVYNVNELIQKSGALRFYKSEDESRLWVLIRTMPQDQRYPDLASIFSLTIGFLVPGEGVYLLSTNLGYAGTKRVQEYAEGIVADIDRKGQEINQSKSRPEKPPSKK